MDIHIKMDKDFERTLSALQEKYGEDFEYLNGIHESQLNFSDFINGFVNKNVADATIDSNANAATKDIRSLLSEKGKSEDKLFAANKIFYELKKKYGLKIAKEWLETEYNGGFYLHDFFSSSYIAYCFAYDLSRLAREGLFFLKNYNNQPPKHLTTFIDDVIEFISYMSNRSSGEQLRPFVSFPMTIGVNQNNWLTGKAKYTIIVHANPVGIFYEACNDYPREEE